MKNDWRQALHLEPLKGWLNDPNGLSYFKDRYHVYFQYSPESALGKGGKCWGHFEGKDLTDWRFTGAVLRPDSNDDRSGVYSGCGFVKGDKLYLFYTGNVKEEGEHDYITSGRGANVILVTTEDGILMSEKRTLLTNADYPEYCSCHVRDPKVWEEDGHYKMVLGARTLDDKGCVLFYTSDDLYEWKFESSLSVDDFGFMWECPDVIFIGGRRFLSISPQGLEHGEYENQNVYSSGYFRYDDGLAGFEEWDYGFDFYAPQTFKAKDLRTLLIGWQGIGDIPYKNPTAELGRQHCLTIPRELSLDADGNILQRPIRELDKLKKQASGFADGDTFKAELPFSISTCRSERFKLTLAGILDIGFENGVFTLGFNGSPAGAGRDKRRVRLERFEGLEMIADKSSLEIFINGGRKVMGTRFYPDDTLLNIKAEGVSGTVSAIDPMEVVFDA